MKRKILILEDNLVELETAFNELSKDNIYDVETTSDTAEADDQIENGKGKLFDCLIIDLNITNEYLDDSLRSKTHGGSLTGWVWLYNVAKKDIRNDIKIIIYSEFIKELTDEMEDNKNINDKEIEYFNNIKLISKADAVNGSDHLLEEVNNLFRKKG